MEIEQHPLEPFLPGNALLLMLGSFRHKRSGGAWSFITPTGTTICGGL